MPASENLFMTFNGLVLHSITYQNRIVILLALLGRIQQVVLHAMFAAACTLGPLYCKDTGTKITLHYVLMTLRA